MRRHLSAITRALDSGLSCAWLVPDALVSTAAASALLDQVAARADTLRVLPPRPGGQVPAPTGAQPDNGDVPPWARAETGLLDLGAWDTPPAEPRQPAERLLDRVANLVDLDVTAAADPLTTLVAADGLRGRVIVVSAWEETRPGDLRAMLARFPAVVGAHGFPQAERPRLLVAGRERDLPGAVLDRLDALTTCVRWWWGAYSRLDTAVVVAAARDGGLSLRELVATEVITEIAGPDLALAADLAATWDGRFDTLPDLLHSADACQTAAPSPVRSVDRPPRELRDAWDAGQVDLWDGQVRFSPRCLPTDVRNLIWRGQHRALTPVIDSLRARLAETVRKRASMAVIAEITGEHQPAPVLELGSMAWAVQTRRVRLPGADSTLLMCLRDLRNRLAHLRPLTDADLDRLTAAIGDTPW